MSRGKGSTKLSVRSMLCAIVTSSAVVMLYGTQRLYRTYAFGGLFYEIKEESVGVRHGQVRGFLLPVYVDQQLTGGLKGFMQLATLAALFNLSTVEPYVQGTRLVGVPKFSEGRDPGVLRLSELFDWKDLRRHFKTCSTRNSHLLSSFETFLRNASRDVILVHMVQSPHFLKSFFFNTDAKFVKLSPSSKTKNLVSGVSLLNKWAKNIQKQKHFAPFRTTNIVLVDARPKKALPLSVIVEKLGMIIYQQVSSGVTVLFDRWTAVTNKVSMGTFYWITGFISRPCHIIDFLKHSDAVVNTSSKFSLGLNDSAIDEIVGVHIRGERLLTEYKGNVSNCLRALKSLLHNLTFNSTKRAVRIIHDLGPFGTKSCSVGRCSKIRKDFVSQIENVGYPIVSFDPTKFPSVPTSSGFAARVEIEYLSNVDVLVTLGRGGFQYTIQERFERKHGKGSKNIHTLCRSLRDIT